MAKIIKEPCALECCLEKKVVVEYLYLDLQSCERCIGTDTILDEVMDKITPALEIAGYTVEYRKTEMKTADLAIKHKFTSSPTVRVNGRDICNSVAENSCGCCSEISSADVRCRVFEYKGESFEVPPKKMLAEAILWIIFAKPNESFSCDNFNLPENLENFFSGKKTKSACSCGGNCC